MLQSKKWVKLMSSSNSAILKTYKYRYLFILQIILILSPLPWYHNFQLRVDQISKISLAILKPPPPSSLGKKRKANHFVFLKFSMSCLLFSTPSATVLKMKSRGRTIKFRHPENLWLDTHTVFQGIIIITSPLVWYHNFQISVNLVSSFVYDFL